MYFRVLKMTTNAFEQESIYKVAYFESHFSGAWSCRGEHICGVGGGGGSQEEEG